MVVARPQHHKYHDRLTLELVRHADRRRLEHRGMRGGSRFYFCRPDPLARDLERVVRASFDIPEAPFIYTGPIAMHPDVAKATPVCGEVLVGIAPEAARHTGPRLANDQLAHGAAERAALRVGDVSGNAGHGARKAGRLDRRPGRRAENAAGAFGAARVVDERGAPLADDAEVPPPRLGIPRFAGRAEHEQ